MYHSEYEIRLLAEQRSAELIAEAERLNQLHDARRRHRRKYLRSLLARFRPSAPARTEIDLRTPPPAEPIPNPAAAAEGSRATST